MVSQGALAEGVTLSDFGCVDLGFDEFTGERRLFPICEPLIEGWAFDMEYMHGGYGLGASRAASLALEWPVFVSRHTMWRTSMEADAEAVRKARENAQGEGWTPSPP